MLETIRTESIDIRNEFTSAPRSVHIPTHARLRNIKIQWSVSHEEKQCSYSNPDIIIRSITS